MFSTEYFANEINRWVSEINYPSKPAGLYEPIAYMLAGGGKRLRPTLMCAVASALGLPVEVVRQQAVALEMFHNFTLLHDDVMDNADVRHGKPTVHCKWDIPTAILSGDTMLTMASQMMGDCPDEFRRDIVALFERTAIEIYEGQQYDMNFEKRTDVTEHEYLEMIRLKTAVLLGCACRIGAMRAGAEEKVQSCFYSYGIYLGLAFQLRDDYLDTFGDPLTFGKAIGGDILNDKKTWLSIAAQAVSPAEMDIARKITNPGEKIAAVKAIYKAHNIDCKCATLVDEYTKKAVCELNGLNIPADALNFFISLAQSATRRSS